MKIVQTEIAELIFDKNESILYINIKEGAEMNLQNTKVYYETINEITQHKPYIALIDTEHYFTIDSETLKYASLKETIGKRVATAHYSLNLANRLTTYAFKINYKPPIPLKQFKTKEDALAWLKTHLKS